MIKKLLKISLVCSISLYAMTWLGIYSFSQNFHGNTDLDFGNIDFPSKRTLAWETKSEFIEAAIKKKNERSGAAQLKLGEKRFNVRFAEFAVGNEIEFLNQYLKQAQPWWKDEPREREPFTAHALILLLYNFGDRPELLYPDTVEHITKVLLTEKGGEPKVHAVIPRKAGFLWRDTENLVLMNESSRYLTNQWLADHGDSSERYDNVKNGLESFMIDHLNG
ncbi:MAG: hypothetical protein AB8G77_26795, partial [Rhodothermales bacterium]